MLNTSKITKDFKELFLKIRQGHLTEYVYYGEDFFEQLLTNNQQYYPYYSEVELIKNHARTFTNTLGKNKNIVEIGPGSDRAISNKTVQIIKQLHNIKSYTAIDSYLLYAQKAAHHVTQATHAKTLAIQISCFNKELTLPKNTVLMFLGGTFCNFEDKNVESFIKDIASKMKKDDIFIVSIDSNQDSNYIKNAYDNIWLKGLAFNTFSFFKEKFKVKNFNDKLFEYKYNWEPKLAEVQILLTATKEQNFIFDDIEIHIEPNQDFHIITSKKRDESFYIDTLKKYRLELIEKIEHEKDQLKILITKAI